MLPKQKLLIDQLDRKIAVYKHVPDPPAKGWVNAVRVALKMTFKQLGQKAGISTQSVAEMVEREANGSITLKNLREVAQALDMRLVYGLIPKEGSIEKMLDKQADAIARKIVMRTSQTMRLEDQEVSQERLEKAIAEMAHQIKSEMPKYLWD